LIPSTKILKKEKEGLGVAAHTYNPSYAEAEVGESWSSLKEKS
jgi:hypothetical protein